MSDLATTAPAFVEIAHRIVWCTVATVAPSGQPRSRVLHPIWEWDGESLTGWIATSPQSHKRRDLDANSRVSLTYWDQTHDTCTADCDTEWVLDDAGKREVWDRFKNAAPPVGYDPSLIPQWTKPEDDAFGGLLLKPTWLRVFPGTMLLEGRGDVHVWRA